MRIIKFRIWNGNRFHYPEATEEQSNHYLQFGSGGFWLFNEKGRMVTATELGGECNQFIGLKDINGKEIYEGDILNYFNKDNHHTKFSEKYVVEFCNQDLGSHSYQQTFGWNATAVHRYNNENLKGRGNGILSLFGTHKIEVVGNIYENPELLVEN